MFKDFWLILWSNGIYYFTLTVGIFLYAPIADARKNFLTRFMGCIAIASIITIIVTLFDQWQLDTFQNNAIISSYALSITAIISLWLCFRSSVTRMLYSAVAGFMLAQIYMQPAKILQNLTNISGVSPIISCTKIASCLILYALLYLLFIRHIADNANYKPAVRQVVILLVFAVVVLLSTLLESIVLASDAMAYVLLCLGETLLCFVVLYNHYVDYLVFERETRRAVELELERAEIRQFENYRQLIDVLNIKCHDLKHQIRELGGRNSLSPEIIDELNKTAELYDSYVKTGNDTIDTVLTEKSLRCEALGIQMTWMLDGEGLSYMTPYDINALFGNALDNAIQCEGKISEDKRYVAIACKRMPGLIHISITNYIEEAPLMDLDGLPMTAGDKYYHGFGMKSMRQITEKYGGHLRVTVAKNTFSLGILLPYHN